MLLRMGSAKKVPETESVSPLGEYMWHGFYRTALTALAPNVTISPQNGNGVCLPRASKGEIHAAVME